MKEKPAILPTPLMAVPSVDTADRLGLTFVLAVALHVSVIFGVGFTTSEDDSLHQANTLDIILVQNRMEKAPEKAAYLAQANQEGGGNSEEKVRPGAPLPSPFTSKTPALAATVPPPTGALTARVPGKRGLESRTEAREKPVLTQAVASWRDKVMVQSPARRSGPREPRKIPEKTPSVIQPVAPMETIDASALVQRSLAITSLNAEIQERLRAYAERPKRKWITARTQEYKYASYMEAWRAKVEQVGNLNYPADASRRSLSGNLLLEVAINANGSLNDINLHRSSGYKILDDAAIRIVRLAAPYAPLPKNIRKETDILHIERTWQFLPANRLTAR